MRKIKISLLFLTALLLTACQPFTGPDTPVSSSPTLPTRPNILIILSDDQRYDTMDYMPRTVARIFKEGVAFPNAYITTSLCCPKRVTKYGDSASVQAVTRVNAEQASKRTMRRPTRLPYRGRLIRLG